MAKLRTRKPLTRSEMMEASASIIEEKLNGLSDVEIMDAYGYDAETYSKIMKFWLDHKSEELRTKPREHVYMEYVIEQRRNIKDLNDFIKDADDRKQYNAKVGAIRLRSDIVDKIIAKGQEFGFIKKTPERKEMVAGLIIAELSTKDLMGQIIDQNKMIQSAMKRFGDGEFLDTPEEALHYGPTFDTTAEEADEDDEEEVRRPEKATGKLRAKTSRRSAGRKRVRE